MRPVNEHPTPLISSLRFQRGSRPPRCPPVHGHPELRQREGDEDVDRVEHHQQVDAGAGADQDHARRKTHREHAVLGDQAGAQVGKAPRQPAVGGHRGEHPRTVDKAGLRRDEQQRPFRQQRKRDDRRSDVEARNPPMPGHPLEQHRIEGLSGHRRNVVQHVAEEDAARDEGQRDRHVDHRALAGHGARFAQDRQAVADRLDSGVSAAAEAIGAQEDDRERDETERADAADAPR